MKKRFNEEQIIGFLKEIDAGLSGNERCCKHGFSVALDIGNKICRLSVMQIDSTEAEVKLLPVELSVAKNCSDTDNKKICRVNRVESLLLRITTSRYGALAVGHSKK